MPGTRPDLKKPGTRPILKKPAPQLSSQQSIEQLLNADCAQGDTACKYTEVFNHTDEIEMINWIHHNPSASFFNTMTDPNNAENCNMKAGTVANMFDIKLEDKDTFFSKHANKIAEGGQELYTQCGIYCKDDTCDMLSYVQTHADILRGHCQEVHVLKPGVEGLYHNYNLFTTKAQPRADDPEQEEIIDTGFAIQDVVMCGTRLGFASPTNTLG
jgi:hypothetical protein